MTELPRNARFLSDSVSPQPLVHGWYAWPHMLPPHTAGFNLRERCLPIMDSYLRSPKVHASALRNPDMYGGPFLDPQGAPVEAVRELREHIHREARSLLEFADDIDTARRLLADRATGGPLDEVYAGLPTSLRGCVELVYDTLDRPTLRFLEPLLYRNGRYPASAQSLSLLRKPDLSQPFVFGSPTLPSPDRFELTMPFASGELDALFAARHTACDVEELADRLGIDDGRRPAFRELFSADVPQGHQPVGDDELRVRYFGHACVLLETKDSAVLLDPLPGYPGDGLEHFGLNDMPPRLDAVVLSHAHPDHVNLESLLQLRHRVDRIVVPAGSDGNLEDPDLGALLRALGFSRVESMSSFAEHPVGPDARVLALPFFGEHADLDIRSKMVPVVDIGGHRIVFATDSAPQLPEMYGQFADELGAADALFIGLESVGAPMSWLYGPLLGSSPTRDNDNSRRTRGSNADLAEQMVRQFGARNVFAYAMGLEPWLRHLTGSAYDPESEQIRETDTLLERCRAKGIPAELLYLRAEFTWPKR